MCCLLNAEPEVYRAIYLSISELSELNLCAKHQVMRKAKQAMHSESFLHLRSIPSLALKIRVSLALSTHTSSGSSFGQVLPKPMQYQLA